MRVCVRKVCADARLQGQDVQMLSMELKVSPCLSWGYTPVLGEGAMAETIPCYRSFRLCRTLVQSGLENPNQSILPLQLRSSKGLDY
jgi:hypothetical protein